MYLTFDVGTTSVKTVLYDKNGGILHKVIKEYKLESPKVDWYEVNPEEYWNAVMDGFSEILKVSGVDPSQIRTISGCSQGETVILLDSEDNPIRPAIVWIDNRAIDEVEELKKVVSREEFYLTTGLIEMEPTWSVFKLMWIKNHEPENFRLIDKIFLVEDYIVYRLTQRFVSSCSLLTSTGLIDIVKKRYWDRTVDYLGIRDKLPEMVPEGSIVGKLVPEIASRLGLTENTLVIKGSMDQATSAVGAGNIDPGIITETTGSALVVAITSEEPVMKKDVPLPLQPHVIEDRYLILPYAQTAGIVYKWFKDEFGGDLMGDSDRYDELNRLAESVKPGSDGLIVLPFLAGASYPENDPYAKGVFYGVTLKHTRGHFVRAIMESIAFMLKKILLNVEKSGIKVDEVHSMGGGAKSDFWLQIKADVCGFPFIRMKEEETSTLGAAIIAATRIGDFSSVEEAVRLMVKKDRVFYPRENLRGLYDDMFDSYNKIYYSLKPIFRKSAFPDNL